MHLIFTENLIIFHLHKIIKIVFILSFSLYFLLYSTVSWVSWSAAQLCRDWAIDPNPGNSVSDMHDQWSQHRTLTHVWMSVTHSTGSILSGSGATNIPTLSQRNWVDGCCWCHSWKPFWHFDLLIFLLFFFFFFPFTDSLTSTHSFAVTSFYKPGFKGNVCFGLKISPFTFSCLTLWSLTFPPSLELCQIVAPSFFCLSPWLLTPTHMNTSVCPFRIHRTVVKY